MKVKLPNYMLGDILVGDFLVIVDWGYHLKGGKLLWHLME